MLLFEAATDLAVSAFIVPICFQSYNPSRLNIPSTLAISA